MTNKKINELEREVKEKTKELELKVVKFEGSLEGYSKPDGIPQPEKYKRCIKRFNEKNKDTQFYEIIRWPDIKQIIIKLEGREVDQVYIDKSISGLLFGISCCEPEEYFIDYSKNKMNYFHKIKSEKTNKNGLEVLGGLSELLLFYMVEEIRK